MVLDKSLISKLLIEKLPEFNYTYGDPRTYFLQYVLSLNNMSTYITNTNKFKKNEVFIHKCVTNRKKKLERNWIPPSKKNMKLFHENIINNDKPLLIIPILMENKTQCDLNIKKNIAKHVNYLLYNKNTKELERIDIKKYHIKDFKIKSLFKKIDKKMYKYFPVKYEDYIFIDEHDVTYQFEKVMKSNIAKYIYPIFLITYMNLRSQFPQYNSTQIYNKIYKLSYKRIIGYWNNYVEFCQNLEKINKLDKCSDEYVYNPESNKCLSYKSKSLNKLKSDIPDKECDITKVFNILTNKCVDKNKLFDIEIFLNKVDQAKLKKDAKLKSLGLFSTAIPATLFIISKYNNAFLVANKIDKTVLQTNNDFNITWKWDEKNKIHVFNLLPSFWILWSEGMLNPCRFIIILVSLRSIGGGKHANVLIYDKSTNELERFDALGFNTHEAYNLDGFDIEIEQLFNKYIEIYIPKKIKYFTPIDYCPKKAEVFQIKEMNMIQFDDIHGNCAVWRLWYLNIRLANPDIPRDKLVKYAMIKLEKYGNYARFIKSYHSYILNIAKIE